MPISGFGTFAFDNSGGSTDGLENGACLNFSSSQIYNDVWFCWTAVETGQARVQTCTLTTLDTRIAVYAGCTCPEGGGIIQCVDDSCSLQTRVEWPAIAGQPYLIRVGSFGAAQFGGGSIEIASNMPAVLFGPVANPANGHLYSLLDSSSWTSAEATAVAMGGHLATVDNAEENEFLRATLLGFDGSDRRGWVGFTDAASEGNFVWISGGPVLFTNWNGGEPNNSSGVEHYAEMFGSNGLWNDNRDTPTGVVVYGLVEMVGTPNCAGDVNSDLRVDLADLAVLLAHFGSGGASLADGDIDGDGDVDLSDLATLLANFGRVC